MDIRTDHSSAQLLVVPWVIEERLDLQIIVEGISGLRMTGSTSSHFSISNNINAASMILLKIDAETINEERERK